MERKGTKKEAKSSLKEQVETGYFGPMKPPLAKMELTTVKKFGKVNIAGTTTVGGLIGFSFSANPTSLNNWSLWANDWNEYRILAMEVEFVPAYEHSFPTNTAIGGLHAMFVDRTSVIGTPTLSQVLNNEGSVYASINQRLKLIVKATGAEEMSWVPVNSPVTTWVVRGTSTQLSISTTYGNYIISYLVEFRGAV